MKTHGCLGSRGLHQTGQSSCLHGLPCRPGHHRCLGIGSWGTGLYLHAWCCCFARDQKSLYRSLQCRYLRHHDTGNSLLCWRCFLCSSWLHQPLWCLRCHQRRRLLVWHWNQLQAAGSVLQALLGQARLCLRNHHLSLHSVKLGTCSRCAFLCPLGLFCLIPCAF